MLQHGMNYCQSKSCSVLLMSRRAGAPYEDEVVDDGRVLIYEGHDVPKRRGIGDPKRFDQPLETPGGKLTPNGLFFHAARDYAEKNKEARLVRVYEKIKDGIWTYNGIFKLVDAWQQLSGRRKVFKFRLEITDQELPVAEPQLPVDHSRLIPSAVKREVYKRDKACCVLCGRKDNLHFDHDFPYSKGGTSMSAKNIRLLCIRHNLAKGAKVE